MRLPGAANSRRGVIQGGEIGGDMAATATVNTKDLVGQIIGNDRYDLRELLGGGHESI